MNDAEKTKLEEALMGCVERAGEQIVEDQIAEAELRRTWQDRMFKKYPEIFQDRKKPMSMTAMCWGLECGFGWEKLLDRLCANLTAIRKASGIKLVASQVKEKYGTLRFYLTNEDWCPGRPPAACTGRFSRVRTVIKLFRHSLAWKIYDWKNRILWKYYDIHKKLFPKRAEARRIRNDIWNDIIDACIHDAERRSAYTCEECGADGKLNQGGWCMVRCVKHWEGPGTYEDPDKVEEEEEHELAKTDNVAV